MATSQARPARAKLLVFTSFCWRAIPIFFLLSGIAGAQSRFVQAEAFGGFSHLGFQSGYLGFGPWSQMNGAEIAVSLPHIFKDLGVMADGSAHYSGAFAQYNYAVGPQYKYEFARFRVVAHALYGRAQTRIRQQGTTFVGPSDRQRSLIFGVAFDYPINDRWMWRVLQGDYVRASAFGMTPQNIRASTGLVYRFGKH